MLAGFTALTDASLDPQALLGLLLLAPGALISALAIGGWALGVVRLTATGRSVHAPR